MGGWFDIISYHYGDNLSVSFKSSNHSEHPGHPHDPGKQALIIARQTVNAIIICDAGGKITWVTIVTKPGEGYSLKVVFLLESPA